MGRLSAYAKNRILKLRFKKNKRIIHIVEILRKDDNIKVSRQAVSTFLKKYLETNSIYDKPRTGRKRKLTQEEIQLIGQVTRLNRDITARAIKEYLNLNVSTYTILRATKLFEWNKINPNSNDSKKAAALERQLNGDTNVKSTKQTPGKRVKRKSTSDIPESGLNTATVQIISMSDDDMNLNDKSIDDKNSSINEIETVDFSKLESSQHYKSLSKDQNTSAHETNYSEPEKVDLNLITHKELLTLKNLSCSPMSFATKILFKIFKIEELHGHNVSGKTLNKNLKAKLPLDTIRVGYIKFLVEKYYDEKECKEMLSGSVNHKQDLWKSCHTAINKSILISERKAAAAQANGSAQTSADPNTTSNGLLQLTNDDLEDRNNKTMTTDDLNDDEDNDTMRDSDDDDDDDLDDDDDSDDFDVDSDSDSSDYDLVKKEKFINKKQISKVTTPKAAPAATPTSTRGQERRRSNRLKKPTQKLTEQDDGDDEDDDDKLNDENGVLTRVKDEDEVELIQNIENRQKTKNTNTTNNINNNSSSISNNNNNNVNTNNLSKTKGSPSTPSKQPLSNITAQTPQNQSARTKRRKQDQESSEATAAANIAAAMKKRLVVVASNQKNSN